MTLWLEYSSAIRWTGMQSHVESYKRLPKMILDATLLNTQYYRVRIKVNVEQSREKRSAIPSN